MTKTTTLVLSALLALGFASGASAQQLKKPDPKATSAKPAAKPAAKATAAKATGAAAGAAAGSAGAKPVGQGQGLATYGEWGVYVSQTAAGKVCYAGSQPKKRDLASLKDTAAYFLISTRPKENVRNEMSIAMGYALKAGADATLSVAGASFALYTNGQGAWIKNAAEEPRAIQALRGGTQVIIKGTSGKGNVATDTYSLNGLAQALDRVAQECAR